MDGSDIFAFHLRRYLEDWLDSTGLDYVLVAPGFEHSGARLGVFEVGRETAQAVEAPWVFCELCEAWRNGHERLVGDDGKGGSAVYTLIAVTSEDGDLLGFLLVGSGGMLGQGALKDLRHRVEEALMAARRNGVRLFFDEGDDDEVKARLYGVLERMPEWLGCDHSASILLTHDLDAMTLENQGRGVFNILADRHFEAGQDMTRRVGMKVDAQGNSTIIADALSRFRAEPAIRPFAYHHVGEGRWRASGEEPSELASWYGDLGRSQAATAVLIPLVAREGGEPRLYGFVQLEWCEGDGPPQALAEVAQAIGDYLGRWLAHSPLFKLTIQKMWLVRSVGQWVESALQQGRDEEAVIEGVVELIKPQVDVPSLAFGVRRLREGNAVLDFVYPYGWSRYDDLQLAVEVDSHQDSSVAALAVRLGRPIVLAGGYGSGEEQSFNNYLWVDEEQSRLIDERMPAMEEAIDDADYHRLSDYYKAAREEAYATLAYPMVYADEVLGVLAVEVDRETDWLWWTGFGGHLLWSMIAREVAMGLYWGRRS